MSLPAAPRHPRRIAYLGTPQMAVPPLRALVGAGYEVPLVVSRPDARRGRGGQLTPSPVKAAATELGIVTTDRIDDLRPLAESGAVDLGVVVAFGQIIRAPVLAALPLVNLHFSLLPRWRGAAPVERAILAGDDKTGVCLMVVEETLDTGGVYRRLEVPIGSEETADQLRRRLTDAGAGLLLDAFAEGLEDPVPQAGEVSYAEKVVPADLRLDWDRPANELARIVRLGGAHTTFRGKRLKVLAVRLLVERSTSLPGSLDGPRVATGAGSVELVTVQPEGKPSRSADEWLNGARPRPGERLGG